MNTLRFPRTSAEPPRRYAPVGFRLSRFSRRSLLVFRLLSASTMFIVLFKNNKLLETRGYLSQAPCSSLRLFYKHKKRAATPLECEDKTTSQKVFSFNLLLAAPF